MGGFNATLFSIKYIYMSSTPQFTLNYLNKLVSQKSSWTITLDMPIDPMIKYASFTTYSDLAAAYPDYLNDITDEGAWNCYLTNLLSGGYCTDNPDEEPLTRAEGLFYLGYTGDYVITPNELLISFNTDLPSLTDGSYMFNYCVNLAQFNSNLPNLTRGEGMFEGCESLAEWSTELPKLNDGDWMFAGCPLTEWTIRLDNLSSGRGMFSSCPLTEWTIPLGNLVDGESMFHGCDSLTLYSPGLYEYGSVLEGLVSLENGNDMFNGCTSLTSFSSELETDLNNLQTATGMFMDCNLSHFYYDLESLRIADNMFAGNTNLSSFLGYLPNLWCAVDMFSGCNLDLPSVERISRNINHLGDRMTESDIETSIITIDYNPEITEETITPHIELILAKGWNVMANGIDYPAIDLEVLSGTSIDAWNPGSLVKIVDDIFYHVDAESGETKPTVTTDCRLSELTYGGQVDFAAEPWSSFVLFDSPLTALEDGNNFWYNMGENANGIDMTFKSHMPNLTVIGNMFQNATFANISITAHNLTDITQAFADNTYVKEITFDGAEIIETANNACSGCTNLTTFECHSALVNASEMFSNCSSLNSFNGRLELLLEGLSMFSGCSALTSFDSDLPSLTDGEAMFANTALTSFNGKLLKLTDGSHMFSFCMSLNSFTSDLSSLNNGYGMFNTCAALTSFNYDLPKLTIGNSMFETCVKLTSWNIDLPILTNGYSMFYTCTALKSFRGDLSSLSNGTWMFKNCTALTSFNSNPPDSTNEGNSLNLGNVVDGRHMFYGCRNLWLGGTTTFDLSSLESGDYMFVGVECNGRALDNIISSLPAYSDGSSHNIHITGRIAAESTDYYLFGVGTYIPSYDEAMNSNMWVKVPDTKGVSGWNIYFASSSSGWTVTYPGGGND